MSNAQLLHTYGFIEQDNDYDSVMLPIQLVLDECKKIELDEESKEEV